MGNLTGLNLAHKLPFDKRVFVIDVAQICWTEMIFKVISNHSVILNFKPLCDSKPHGKNVGYWVVLSL